MRRNQSNQWETYNASSICFSLIELISPQQYRTDCSLNSLQSSSMLFQLFINIFKIYQDLLGYTRLKQVIVKSNKAAMMGWAQQVSKQSIGRSRVMADEWRLRSWLLSRGLWKAHTSLVRGGRIPLSTTDYFFTYRWCRDERWSVERQEEYKGDC